MLSIPLFFLDFSKLYYYKRALFLPPIEDCQSSIANKIFYKRQSKIAALFYNKILDFITRFSNSAYKIFEGGQSKMPSAAAEGIDWRQRFTLTFTIYFIIRGVIIVN